MNIHTDAVFNTVIHNNRYVIPFILAYISIDPYAVHMQMEDIKKNIQDATSNYFVGTPISEKILYIAEDTTKYTKAFIQSYHSYYKSKTSQDRLTPDIRSEARAATAATATATTSVPDADSSTIPLSNSTDEPSIFISTHSPYNPG